MKPSDCFRRGRFYTTTNQHLNSPSLLALERTAHNGAHKRNALGERLNISIRSFDALTDVLDNRRFPALETSRVDATVLPPVEILHELANPFFRAFTHTDWAAIRAEPSFNSRFHMIQTNAEILLKHRKLNSGYSDFLQTAKTAPEEHQLDLFRHELRPFLNP